MLGVFRCFFPNPDQRSEECPRQGKPNTQGPTSAFRHLIDFEKLLQNSGIGPLVSDQNTSALDLPTQPPIQSSALESTPLLETEPGVNFIFGLNPVRLGSDDTYPHPYAKRLSLQYININLVLKGRSNSRRFVLGARFISTNVLESRPKIVPLKNGLMLFFIFSSIFRKKHPSKTQELLQYMSIIREAASRSPSSFAWRQYDEHFQLGQATQALKLNLGIRLM